MASGPGTPLGMGQRVPGAHQSAMRCFAGRGTQKRSRVGRLGTLRGGQGGVRGGQSKKTSGRSHPEAGAVGVRPEEAEPIPRLEAAPDGEGDERGVVPGDKVLRGGGGWAGREGRAPPSAPRPRHRAHLAGGADVPALRLLQLLEAGLQQAAAALGHHCGEGSVRRRFAAAAAGRRGGSYRGRARGRG